METILQFWLYSESCIKRPLSKRPQIGFQDHLSLNAGWKYCRMLQGEHSAILSTYIKLPFVIMSPPLGSGDILFFPGHPSVCLSVTNRVRSVTWKPRVISLWTLCITKIECKNSNSVIYTLWVISLGTLSMTKTIIYDYFIPGYDCVIVNYIDRYLY